MVSPRKRKMLKSLGMAPEVCHGGMLGYATWRLCNEPPTKIHVVRNEDGKMLANEKEVRQRWREHFAEVLNRPHAEQKADSVSEVYQSFRPHH